MKLSEGLRPSWLGSNSQIQYKIYKTLLSKSESLRATVLKVAILGTHVLFHSNQCKFLIHRGQHHYSSNPGSESLANDSPIKSPSLSELILHYPHQNEVQPPSEAGTQSLNLGIKVGVTRMFSYPTYSAKQNKTKMKKKK